MKCRPSSMSRSSHVAARWVAPAVVCFLPLAASAQQDGSVDERPPVPTMAQEQWEGAVYEGARASVFRVEASGGEGSGFLVDRAGLVLTNFHVVKDARYIAVQLDQQAKYPGELVAKDEDNDLAVIRVHPDATATLEPLQLRGDTPEQALATGERVLAIGFPLGQDSVLTTGVVSRVEATTLITDVSINPGSSGGPILDRQGRVVAVSTFAVQGEHGPGIGGAVRAAVAEDLLPRARDLAASNEAPAADRLPVAPRDPFPVDTLRQCLAWERTPKDYHLEAGKFDVFIGTPVSSFYSEHWREIKAAKRQAKRRRKGAQTGEQNLYDPAGNVFNWQQYAGAYPPVVALVAIPEVKETGGSRTGRIFGAMFGVVTPGKYRFKRDFREMTLVRDGKVVTPIVPGRRCEAVEIQGYGSLNDVGCMGEYHYRPEDFLEGREFQLIVTSEEEPDKQIVADLDAELLRQIRQDFAGFLETSHSSVEEAATMVSR